MIPIEVMTVVLLGATPVLVEACRRAAAAVGSAHETDGSELEALARDVGAELVCVSAAGTSVLTLERELQPVFEEAFRKRSGASA